MDTGGTPDGVASVTFRSAKHSGPVSTTSNPMLKA
jgi:hypothetical protein